jgi:hypothetical protein
MLQTTWDEAHKSVYAALEAQARKTAAKMIKAGAKRYLEHPKLLDGVLPCLSVLSPDSAIPVLDEAWHKGWIRAWQYRSAVLVERYWRRFQ